MKPTSAEIARETINRLIVEKVPGAKRVVIEQTLRLDGQEVVDRAEIECDAEGWLITRAPDLRTLADADPDGR